MNKTNYLKRFIYILSIMSLVLVGIFTSKVILKAEGLVTVTYESSVTGNFTTQIEPGTSAENFQLGKYNGKRHVGWYEDAQLTVPHQFGALTEDITLHAKWTNITYTFNLNIEGVTDPIVISGTVDDLLTKLENAKPDQEGLMFSGWFLENTYQNKVSTQDELLNVLNNASSNNHVELFGKEIKERYLAIFNFNGTLKYVWIKYGETITPPAAPAVEGFTLDSENPFTPAVPSTMPASHQTFVANYVANKIVITFVNDNDEILDNVSTDYGKIPQYHDIPTSSHAENDANKYYHVFSGWDSNLVPAKEDKTYKATYNKYPYLYQLRQIISDKTYLTDVAYGADLMTLLTTPEPPIGQVFDGWEGMPTDGKMPAEPLTLTAKFAPITGVNYTVRHLGESLDDPEVFDVELFVDETKTGAAGDNTNAQAKNHHHFTAKAVTQIPIAHDGTTVVVVEYTRKSYQVTFNLDGGTPAIGSQTIKYQGLVTKPTNPTKTGYEFVEWQKGEEKYIFTTEVSSNFELVAIWTPEGDTPYQVKHYQQQLDGNYDLENPNAIDNLTGTTGYSTNAQAKDYLGFIAKPFDQVEISADGNTVINIYYERASVTVIFNLNGGTLNGLNPVQVYQFGEKIIEPNGTPTKANYTFSKWALNGSDIAYNFNKNIEQVGVIILVALYDADTKSLTINGNSSDQVTVFVNDSLTPYNQVTDTVKYGDVLTVYLSYDPNIYTETLKINDVTVTPVYQVFTYEVTSDTTITFDLEIEQVTITFDTKEGTPVVASQTINKYNQVSKPTTNPTKDHYTFSHWSETDGGLEYDFTKPVEADMTLFAVYVIDQHSVIYNEVQNTVIVTANDNNISSGSLVEFATRIKITPQNIANTELIKVEVVNNETDEILATILPEQIPPQDGYEYVVLSDIRIIVYYEEIADPTNLINVMFVVSVPEGTSGKVYMCGSAQGWNLTNAVELTLNPVTGNYEVTLQLLKDNQYEYKYLLNRTWDNVEVDANGDFTQNRQITVTEGTTSINDTVARWKIIEPPITQSTITFSLTVPEGTPEDAVIYMIGIFPGLTPVGEEDPTANNYWYNFTDDYKMEKQLDGKYTLDITADEGYELKYKYVYTVDGGTTYIWEVDRTDTQDGDRHYEVLESRQQDDVVEEWNIPAPPVTQSTITFSLTVPEGTPENATIYMIGVFPGLVYPGAGVNPTEPTHQWNNFTNDYMMAKQQDGKYTLDITADEGYELKYKYVYTVDGGTTYIWEVDRTDTQDGNRHYEVLESRQQDDIVEEWAVTPPQPGENISVTFNVTFEVPEGEIWPEVLNDQIRIAGGLPESDGGGAIPNYSKWNTDDAELRLEKGDGNTYSITISVPINTTIEYKYLAGRQWSVYGEDRETNRSITLIENGQVINDVVIWKDHIYDLAALNGKNVRLVKFKVNNLDSTNQMFIAGNFPQYHWDHNPDPNSYSGLQMEKTSDQTHFELDVWLENDVEYLYKYTRDQDNIPGKKWEPDPNRTLDKLVIEKEDTITTWGW